jgi:predicted RNase H-like HicB family nuclease
MPPILLLVRNICIQGEAPEEVLENVEILSEVMAEIEADIKAGKVL